MDKKVIKPRNRLANLSKLKKLSLLADLTRLHRFVGWERTRPLESLGDLGDLSDLGELGELGKLGDLGDLGKYRDLEKLGDLGSLCELADLCELGQLGDFGDRDLRKAIGPLNPNIGKLGRLGRLGKLRQLGNLEKLAVIPGWEHLAELKRLWKLGRLAKLGQLGILRSVEFNENSLDLKELGHLGQLGQLGLLGKLGKLAYETNVYFDPEDNYDYGDGEEDKYEVNDDPEDDLPDVVSDEDESIDDGTNYDENFNCNIEEFNENEDLDTYWKRTHKRKRKGYREIPNLRIQLRVRNAEPNAMDTNETNGVAQPIKKIKFDDLDEQEAPVSNETLTLSNRFVREGRLGIKNRLGKITLNDADVSPVKKQLSDNEISDLDEEINEIKSPAVNRHMEVQNIVREIVAMRKTMSPITMMKPDALDKSSPERDWKDERRT